MKPHITIGHLPILDHLILGVADHNDGKYYKNFSLATKRFSNFAELGEAIEQNKIDGVFILCPLALDIYRRTGAIQTILLGHREGQVLVVKNEIKKVADLAGKTIFIPHRLSTHYILLHKILQRVGLNIEKDVRLEIGCKDIREVVTKFEQGKIDAFIIAEPLGTEIRQRKLGKILILSHDIEQHHIDCVLVVHKDIITGSPEAVQELVTSLVRAGGFVNAYPRQAAEIGENFLGWPRKLLLEALTHDKGHILFWDLLPRLEDFENLQNTAINELKMLPQAVTLQGFVNSDFAQDAYREWTITQRREVKDKGSERTLPGTFLESANRFQEYFKSEIPTVGLKFILAGQEYPKDIVRSKEIHEPYSVFLEKVFNGQEFIVGGLAKTKKAFCFFQPGRAIEPDRVLIKLTVEQSSRCVQALSFFENYYSTTQFSESSAEADFIESKERVVMRVTKDETWCSVDYNAYKFLTLLLHYF